MKYKYNSSYEWYETKVYVNYDTNFMFELYLNVLLIGIGECSSKLTDI